jgi:hypothetical protein
MPSYYAYRNNKLVVIAIFGLLLFAAAAAVGGYLVYRFSRNDGGRTAWLMEFLGDPSGNSSWMVRAHGQCAGAPFTFPTDGYIG